MTRPSYRSTLWGLLTLALAACAPDDPVRPAGPSSAAAPTLPPFRGDPIVFVHGCPVPAALGGSGTNYRTARLWRTMYKYFRDRGYPAPEWNHEDSIPTSSPTHLSSVPARDNYLNVLVLADSSGNCGSNKKHARELAAYVQRVLAATDAPRVDLVANSMGALAARWYLKFHDGTRYVRDFALLAGVNHGTMISLVTEGLNQGVFAPPHYDAAREATPAYNCDPLLDDFQRKLNGCEGVDEVVELITDDTAEDEVDVRVSWLNIYNPVFDELVVPAGSACLNQRFPEDCSDPVNRGIQVPGSEPHGQIRMYRPVIDAVFEHLTRRGPKPKG